MPPGFWHEPLTRTDDDPICIEAARGSLRSSISNGSDSTGLLEAPPDTFSKPLGRALRLLTDGNLSSRRSWLLVGDN